MKKGEKQGFTRELQLSLYKKMHLCPFGRKYFSVKLSLRPFGTPSAKHRIPSLLFMLTSNKKPGTPPPGVPDPHRRSKRNKVPLGYPLPSSPFGQYKVPFRHGLPSILLAGCFLFSENFIVYCINVCRRSAPPFSLSFPTCGEGFGKGNLVALSSVAEVWNPLRNGFQVFVTF